MANTPVRTPPDPVTSLTPHSSEVSSRELTDLLQRALEPSFVLVRQLGAGGMGIVYLARDPALKRLVAVKVMSPERAHDPEARARFQREAEAVAKISHPNVVAVYSVGELANGLPYLVMQYVEGASMAERLTAEGPLEITEAKTIIGQVASALAAAHAKGVIHRDIKAANILWDDQAGRALVSDFGIAAVTATEGDSMQLTQTGVIVGTPKYMSPEQLLAEPVTEKTDVYSMGLLAYELLAREGPFNATSSPNQMIVAHLRDVPRPITTLRADVDPEFEALLSACLAKDAFARPSAEDIARRLQHSASVVLEWPPPGLEELQGVAVRPVRRAFLGSLMIAVPLTMMVAAGPASPAYLEWPATLILPAVMAMGVLATMLGVADLARLLPLMRRAARAGYSWDILAEVLCDGEKDTGAVIAGEREYSALSVEERLRIRRWRVRQVGLQLGGAFWAIAGVFIGLPIAARLLDSPAAFAFIALGVPLLADIAAGFLAQREGGMLRCLRARFRRHVSQFDRLATLAGAWRESFDRLSTGLSGRAWNPRSIIRRLVAIGAAAVVGVTALATIAGLTAVSTAGKFAVSHGLTTFVTMQDRLAQIERLKKLRAPVDPSITPLQAGEALYALHRGGTTSAPGRVERDPVEQLPKFTYRNSPRGLFAGEWIGGAGMRQAARGLSSEQRAFLNEVAATPGRKQVETIAHAGLADWFGAAVRVPGREMTFEDIPIPSANAMKAATSAHLARAMLALADHHPAEAERMIREVIGVGTVLIDENMLITNLVGGTIVRRGRDELVALYEVTGRDAEARAFSPATDPARNESVTGESRNQSDATGQSAFIERVVRDSGSLRAVRWEYTVFYESIKPCTDLRQIVFGPDAGHYETLAAARKSLVRTAGDDQLMQVAEHALEQGPAEEARRPASNTVERSLRAFAGAVDAMTGSTRMRSCIAIVRNIGR